MKLQHEFFNLSDEDATEVIVTLARLTIEERNMYSAIRKCPFKGKSRDFFIYLAGFEIGLYAAKVSNCPGVRCHECELQEMCNIALEGSFFGTIRSLLKREGVEKAKEFVVSTINKRRREIFDESSYIL